LIFNARVFEEELEALRLVTRTEGEPYGEFIERIACAKGRAGRIARTVKLADLRDNLGRTTPKLSHLAERYRKALVRLAPQRP
jgi:hypothetical protein